MGQAVHRGAGGTRRRRLAAIGALAIALAALRGAAEDAAPAGDPSARPSVDRGRYVFTAAGCAGCHTDVAGGGPPLAGGRALKTPFGTFYTPNITPDRETGIGAWSDADFRRALRTGVAPDGTAYFPAFPYASFTGMSDADIADLKAYLFAQPAVHRANRPHDVAPPFGWRFLVPAWQLLFLHPGPLKEDPSRPAPWNRGRYLVEAVGHCGECHTPRNALGALRGGRQLAGNPSGPEGGKVPNITPDPKDGIGSWSADDITFLLEIGATPQGKDVGDGMAEVVRTSTSHLSDADRQAIATYLRSLPPLASHRRRSASGGANRPRAVGRRRGARDPGARRGRRGRPAPRSRMC